MTDRYLPIEDYAIIGNCSCAALVSREGSIDWLCWPEFDSPAFFAALLDADEGGRFRIRPTSTGAVSRQYIEGTNMLQTTFETRDGTVRLTDFAYAGHEHQYEEKLLPEHQIVRNLECLEGRVEIEMTFEPRPGFGRAKWRSRRRPGTGYVVEHGSEAVVLCTEMDLRSGGGSTFAGTSILKAGESVRTVLAYDRNEPSVLPDLGDGFDAMIRDTASYWRSWSDACRYEGRYSEAVLRSVLTLKLLASSATGAIVAAPTTSLPEKIGGERNWDYRYCWLRDAAFTLRAFLDLGYGAEGTAFFQWLSYAAHETHPDVTILYDVRGNRAPEVTELDHLEGYMGSRPVRVGNAASHQHQLDVFGEIISAGFDFVERGGTLSRWQRKLLTKLGEQICANWQEPDNGIWEKQSERQNHTYSKAMCWVGLDRLVRLHDQKVLEVPRSRFRAVKEEIADAVETRGYHREAHSYSSTFEAFNMDANLLLLALYRYREPSDEKMRGTYEHVRRTLGRGPFLYRYPPDGRDGLPPGEGAFGICSFWAVQYLAERGDVDQAEALFDELLAAANDVGLFAEELDPETRRHLGNFPQALTHVGLINAAIAIAKAHGEQEGVGLNDAQRTWKGRRQ